MRFFKKMVLGFSLCLIFFLGNTAGLKAEHNPGEARQSLERLGVESDEVYRRFGSGERIELRVTYMGLTAGYININTKKTTFEDRPVYRLKMTAESGGAASWMYSVKDTLISYMDIRGLFSWGYDYHKNHNGEKETEKVRYQQEEGFVVRDGEKGGEIPLYTQDVLSAVYYLRARSIEVGEEYSFPVHVDDEVYYLVLGVEELEQIITDNGWQEAFKIVPRLESEKRKKELQEKLKDSSRGVRVWISNDERRLPLQIAIPARFGNLYGYLSSYKPGEKFAQ